MTTQTELPNGGGVERQNAPMGRAQSLGTLQACNDE